MEECPFPIEVLVKHSCSGRHDEIVQQLVHNTEQQWIMSDKEFTEQVRFVAEGVLQNRTRFGEARHLLAIRGSHHSRWHWLPRHGPDV